ncbi:MAG: 4Fe-4S binding protein, partial [Planctomycetota bacterium]
TVNPWHYACRTRIHHALLRLARMIEDYGYHAASYTGNLSANPSVADRLATVSGLGTCDEHGSLVVPEFGRYVIVGAITTDAPLDPTPVSPDVKRPPARRRLSGDRLRFEVERVSRENLVDFIGVASASAFDATVEDLRTEIDESTLGESVVDMASGANQGPFEPQVRRDSRPIRHPRDYVADARSVIVMGMRFPPELIANAGLETTRQIGAYAFCQYQTCLELCFASTEVATCLSRMGYKVAISMDMLGIGSAVCTPRGPLPDARCNALEALAAGLGEIGKSGALLTPEHGPHQRRVVIVTDADIPADTPYTTKGRCTDCTSCIEACPMDAIEGRTIPVRVGEVAVEFPVIPRHRCDWAKRYALCAKAGVALSGDPTDVMPPAGGNVTIEDIAAACGEKDWLTKKRTCVLEACLVNCPAGQEP